MPHSEKEVPLNNCSTQRSPCIVVLTALIQKLQLSLKTDLKCFRLLLSQRANYKYPFFVLDTTYFYNQFHLLQKRNIYKKKNLQKTLAPKLFNYGSVHFFPFLYLFHSLFPHFPLQNNFFRISWLQSFSENNSQIHKESGLITVTSSLLILCRFFCDPNAIWNLMGILQIRSWEGGQGRSHLTEDWIASLSSTDWFQESI